MPIEAINQGDVIMHRNGLKGTALQSAEGGTVSVDVQGKQQTWAFRDLVDVAPPMVGDATAKQSTTKPAAESGD